MKQKIKAILYSVLVVAWFFGSQYMAGLLGKLLYNLGVPNLINQTFLLTLVSYAICIGGLVAFEQSEGRRTREEYKPCDGKTIGRYVSYGIGLWLLTTFINAIFIPFFPDYGDQINGLFDASEPVLRFIVLVIGAPLVEEFIFRGKIQTYLKEAFGSNAAIILQGLMFGLIHSFGLQKIYASVMGIGFGYIREKNDNLWSSTVMHMTINCIGWLAGIITYYMG